MPEWTQEHVNEAIAKIGTKAATDKAFRELVLRDPNEAIKRTVGMDLPEGFKIMVIENAPGIDQTYVLPDFRGGELSEADLEKIAGGVCGKDAATCYAQACAAQA